MKKHIRITPLLIIFLLTLSLAGCGEKNNISSVSDPVQEKTEYEHSEKPDKPEKEEKPEVENTPTESTDTSLDLSSLSEKFIGKWQMITSEFEGDINDLAQANIINLLTIAPSDEGFTISYTSKTPYSIDVAEITNYYIVNGIMRYDDQETDWYLSFAGSHTYTDTLEGTSMTYEDCEANACIHAEDENLLTMYGDFGNGLFKRIPDNTLSASPDIKNNGSYFLEIDDKVFYRSYGDYTLGSAIFGNFMNQPLQDSVTTMHCYNLTENIDSFSFIDYGFGDIYYNNGYFYSTMKTMDSELVYKVDANGDNFTELGLGRIAGLDESTGCILTKFYDEGTCYALYTDDGLELATIIPNEGEALELVTIEQGVAIFVGYKYSIDYTYMYGTYYILNENELLENPPQPDENGEIAIPFSELGTVQCLDALDGYPEIEDVIIFNNSIYISECYYGGTGHFLNDDRVIVADLSGETAPYVDFCLYLGLDAAELEPVYFVINNGYVNYHVGKPYTLSAYDTYSYYSDDDAVIVEYEEYVDGHLFAIVDSAKRDPENDIGWRYNYIRLETRYVLLEDENTNNTMSQVYLMDFE